MIQYKVDLNLFLRTFKFINEGHIIFYYFFIHLQLFNVNICLILRNVHEVLTCVKIAINSHSLTSLYFF